VTFGGEFVVKEKSKETHFSDETFPFDELGKEDNYSTEVVEDEVCSIISHSLTPSLTHTLNCLLMYSLTRKLISPTHSLPPSLLITFFSLFFLLTFFLYCACVNKL
jgi:hypothetical protein